MQNGNKGADEFSVQVIGSERRVPGRPPGLGCLVALARFQPLRVRVAGERSAVEDQ
jgi:hypothetical protein